MRKLAFEIDHRREAQYHLFQFEAAPEMLRQLDRTLSIDDSVLRHRIIRLPGEAPASPPRPADDAVRRQGDEPSVAPEAESEVEAAPEGEAAPGGEVEAAPEPAPVAVEAETEAEPPAPEEPAGEASGDDAQQA
jgi:hypothetical protein